MLKLPIRLVLTTHATSAKKRCQHVTSSGLNQKSEAVNGDRQMALTLGRAAQASRTPMSVRLPAEKCYLLGLERPRPDSSS